MEHYGMEVELDPGDFMIFGVDVILHVDKDGVRFPETCFGDQF